MEADIVENKKAKVIDRFGPWTASNIHLGDHVYTIGEKIQGDEIKVRRVVQVVSDLTRRPLNGLRLLDLACHEGIYAIEFARQGASVLGIEGREAHVEKGRFVKDVLSLNNLDIVQDDVRNLSREKYGCFDVVLCLGILYHLDVPDVFKFIERIAEVCDDIAIIDTRISLGPTLPFEHNGTRYWGHRISEGHKASDTPAQKIERYWASLDNVTSVHLGLTSLYCMLARVGFTSVYQCYIPAETAKPVDRVTVVAIKGKRQNVISSPLMANYPINNSPEEFTAYRMEKMYAKVYRLSRLIPEKIRLTMKSRGLLGDLFKPFKPSQ